MQPVRLVLPSMQGRLAQLVERLVYTENVGGSSPSPPTSPRAYRHDGSGGRLSDTTSRTNV
jgi:hypothetical protein